MGKGSRNINTGGGAYIEGNLNISGSGKFINRDDRSGSGSLSDEATKRLDHGLSPSDHIFISYRRSDSADISGRIYDRLIETFGRDVVFKDVDSIPLGVNFKEYLDAKVGECKVMLAIIGVGWLNASDPHGKPRLNDSADFVRIEIESGLKRKIPVIPLLVGGASMPLAKSLPASLRALTYQNGLPIRPDPDFHRDMDRLISALGKYFQ